MEKILRSGELWGREGRFGGPPRVKAHAGPLADMDEGFEFYAESPPDLDSPKPLWTPSETGLVWEEDNMARMRVLITRVSQEIG
jgi:hypothetical protein